MKFVVFCPAQSRHETTLLPLFRSQRKTSTKEGSSIARVWGSYHLRRLQCVIIKKGEKWRGSKSTRNMRIKPEMIGNQKSINCGYHQMWKPPILPIHQMSVIAWLMKISKMQRILIHSLSEIINHSALMIVAPLTYVHCISRPSLSSVCAEFQIEGKTDFKICNCLEQGVDDRWFAFVSRFGGGCTLDFDNYDC